MFAFRSRFVSSLVPRRLAVVLPFLPLLMIACGGNGMSNRSGPSEHDAGSPDGSPSACNDGHRCLRRLVIDYAMTLAVDRTSFTTRPRWSSLQEPLTDGAYHSPLSPANHRGPRGRRVSAYWLNAFGGIFKVPISEVPQRH
jgi:hypothetical protein